jgi:hypothetical protein
MTYRKPQLTGYSAIAAIQSGQTAKNGMKLEPHVSLNTIPAYEADE